MEVLARACPFLPSPRVCPEGMRTGHGGGGKCRTEPGGVSSSLRSAALKSNNSIQVEEGWQMGGEKKEKPTIKKKKSITLPHKIN